MAAAQATYDGGTEVIQSRRSRQTGTTIDVVRRYEQGLNLSSQQQPDYRRIYETICVEHGGVCEHETRALALMFAAAPLEWCEQCMAAEERRQQRAWGSNTERGDELP